LWHLIFPLFDNAGFHLTYSERVGTASGYISTNGKSDDEISEEILSSSAMNFISETVSPLTIKDFIAYLKASPGVLANPHVRMIYAAAMILDGDDGQALDNLRLAEKDLHPTDKQDFERLLIACLDSHDSALEVLTDFAAKSMHSLGIVAKSK
jgi:hypothetical protein